jgi:hypothetical protein
MPADALCPIKVFDYRVELHRSAQSKDMPLKAIILEKMYSAEVKELPGINY